VATGKYMCSQLKVSGRRRAPVVADSALSRESARRFCRKAGAIPKKLSFSISFEEAL